MRAIFAVKSGSLLAFHVLVACQLTPAARRIWRADSALIRTLLCSARYSTSLARLQVVNGRPSSCGGVLATRQTASRTAGPIRLGRPPLHFGSSAAKPWALNAWITSRAYCGDAANIAAASEALRPCTDASTIPARRSRTRSLAVRVIFTRRCASAVSNERTNTSGCRAITTSASKPSDSPPARSTRHDYDANLSGRGTSATPARVPR